MVVQMPPLKTDVLKSLNARRRRPTPKVFPEYAKYADRIRKTLYHGRINSLERPSLPLTGIMVQRFSRLCKQDGLDKLELYRASSVCYDACVTPCSMLLAFLYSDRLLHTNPEYLENTSSSQVFLIAMMVASKYLYDDGEEDEVFNDEWANSAAILLDDLNQAELEFLFAIDWNLNVKMTEFLSILNNIESDVAKQQGLQRGYFTYTDLLAICNFMPPTWTPLLQLIGKLAMLCAIGYTAAVTSVIVSSLVAQEWCRVLTVALTSVALRPQNISRNISTNNINPTPIQEGFNSKGLPNTQDLDLGDVIDDDEIWMEQQFDSILNAHQFGCLSKAKQNLTTDLITGQTSYLSLYKNCSQITPLSKHLELNESQQLLISEHSNDTQYIYLENNFIDTIKEMGVQYTYCNPAMSSFLCRNNDARQSLTSFPSPSHFNRNKFSFLIHMVT